MSQWVNVSVELFFDVSMTEADCRGAVNDHVDPYGPSSIGLICPLHGSEGAIELEWEKDEHALIGSKSLRDRASDTDLHDMVRWAELAKSVSRAGHVTIETTWGVVLFTTLWRGQERYSYQAPVSSYNVDEWLRGTR